MTSYEANNLASASLVTLHVQLLTRIANRRITVSERRINMDELVADKIFLSHRHLQVFWGGAGDFWQHLWDKFLDFAGNIRATVYVKNLISLTLFYRRR